MRSAQAIVQVGKCARAAGDALPGAHERAGQGHALQRARMRLFRALCSTSARPRASRSGGRYIPNRPR